MRWFKYLIKPKVTAKNRSVKIKAYTGHTIRS